MANQIYSSRTPIEVDKLRQYAPAVFQEAPLGRTSADYDFVPTSRVLDGMLDEGFKVFGVTTAAVRDKTRDGFQKHLLRFRKDEDFDKAEANEIIVINSHDGSCSYQVLGGLFRFACANGLVLGDSFQTLRVVHRANGDQVVSDVLDATYKIASEFERAGEQVEAWRGIELNETERLAFAHSGRAIRWGDKTMNEGWEDKNLLQIKRSDDAAPTLYNVFNRVQENLISGRLSNWKKNADGSRKFLRTRPVRSITDGTRINQGLWDLAEETASIAA
jgi:hypothetical protein